MLMKVNVTPNVHVTSYIIRAKSGVTVNIFKFILRNLRISFNKIKEYSYMSFLGL